MSARRLASPRTEEGSSASVVQPQKRKSTWGNSNRFETAKGWTQQKARDDDRFALLNAIFFQEADAPSAAASSSVGASPRASAKKLPTSDAAKPDGRSRFVVSRPASSLAVPRSVPGTVAPEKTTAEGGGLTGAILKVPGRFYIQPRDSDGRAVAASLADVFRIHIVGLETPQHSIVELDDGRLEVRWLPCVSGDFKLIITINGMHLQNNQTMVAHCTAPFR